MLLGAGEALARQFLAAAWRKLRLNVQPGKRVANPFMDRLVTFRRAQ